MIMTILCTEWTFLMVQNIRNSSLSIFKRRNHVISPHKLHSNLKKKNSREKQASPFCFVRRKYEDPFGDRYIQSQSPCSGRALWSIPF